MAGPDSGQSHKSKKLPSPRYTSRISERDKSMFAPAVPPRLIHSRPKPVVRRRLCNPLIMHYHALLQITVQVSVGIYSLPLNGEISSRPHRPIQYPAAIASHHPATLCPTSWIPTTPDQRFFYSFIVYSHSGQKSNTFYQVRLLLSGSCIFTMSGSCTQRTCLGRGDPSPPYPAICSRIKWH